MTTVKSARTFTIHSQFIISLFLTAHRSSTTDRQTLEVRRRRRLAHAPPRVALGWYSCAGRYVHGHVHATQRNVTHH